MVCLQMARVTKGCPTVFSRAPSAGIWNLVFWTVPAEALIGPWEEAVSIGRTLVSYHDMGLRTKDKKNTRRRRISFI